MKKRTDLLFAAVLTAAFPITTFALTGVANAQSFSCANAQLPSEMAICNNESLLIKDEQVASLLAAKLVSATTGGNIQEVSNEHGSWLKTRNACSNNMDCLERRYDERIISLTGRDL